MLFFFFLNFYVSPVCCSRIEGTTAIEIVSGLHWYLKYWCYAHISWEKTGGVQIASVPKPGFLPLVSLDGVMIQRAVPWSYYQNVVTSSCMYTYLPCFLAFFFG